MTNQPNRSPRSRALHVLTALATALTLTLTLASPSLTQQPAAAASAYQQIRLAEDHIARYIATSRDLLALAEQLKADGTKPAAILDIQERERDAIAKRHGLSSGAEHQAVDWNIWLVIAGMDRKTGNYADPIEPLKQQIAATEADTTLAEPQKRQSLEMLRDELAALQPLQHKDNIALVKRYFREIDGVRLAQFMLAIEQ